jgi:glycerophosphoryl diester phosphodiesterase
LAIAVGADAVECDVRLTRDGHLVLVHDATLMRTSNGGHAAVSALTLAELEQFDFDRRPGAPVPPRRRGEWADARDEARARVLTLDRLLRTLMAAPYPIGISIETKHPNTYGSAVEEATQRVLTETGFPRERVRVMSFSGAALDRMRRIAPDLPLVYLVESPTRRALRGAALPADARIIGPGLHLIRDDPGIVARLHDAGVGVHVWTVDDPRDVDLCLTLGVDAIITNRPATVLTRLPH